ncbi:MAG: DUF1684 domain-containing protein [Flavobacteriales bacterium]|nr:DUF1684 domain-containing protein [Flavobacteriales bacterium]NNK81130.1 DUF1684 domain-containing protein [Flavobacteriales bacterium]
MIKSILPFLSYIFLLGCSSVAQDASDCLATHVLYVEEQTRQFSSVRESPLKEEDIDRFEQLNYYPYDERYCVEAKWIRTPNEEPFEMATSTDRLPVYVKYGELHFMIEEEDLVLSVYQNVELSKEEEYKDYLFIPFNDLTNGVTSYGGGRYFDIRTPEGNSILIDLNNTYHPYCAYNPKYSCPIPPEENVLDMAIEAGVMSGINGEKGEK